MVEKATTTFTYSSLYFILKAEQEGALPSYLGSTLRGGIAWATKKIFCIMSKPKTCTPCALRHSCTYAYLFETPRPQNAENFLKMETVPHPMIILPRCHGGFFRLDDRLKFEIKLFGRAQQLNQYLILAVRQAGLAGFGVKRLRFSLEEVRDTFVPGKLLVDKKTQQITAEPSIQKINTGRKPSGKSLCVDFITPTRLQEDKKLVLEPSFRSLVRAAIFRYRSMAYFHYGKKIEIDQLALLEQAQKVKLSSAITTRFELERYSNRQNKKIPLHGIVGQVEYCGDIKPFWPYLKTAEVIHLGKGTIFGLGLISLSVK